MGRRSHRGFTLVELLVALFALALLAMLSWRGLDGMVRAQRTDARARRRSARRCRSGWRNGRADLDALAHRAANERAGLERPRAAADARSTRRPRRRRRGGRLEPPGRCGRQPLDALAVGPGPTRGEVDEAWRMADAWAQSSGGTAGADEVAITGLLDWQIFYFRSDAWTNPLSSDTVTAAPPSTSSPTSGMPAAAAARAAVMPDGVRIVLSLPPARRSPAS